MGILKILATSFSLGSGGSGGIFSPTLFIGSTFGTAMAGAFKSFLPVTIGIPGAYGIVGMAALFSAPTTAPFTSVIIIFEITRNYSLILPLIAAVSISTLVSNVLTRGTIYTTKLIREGINIDQNGGQTEIKGRFN